MDEQEIIIIIEEKERKRKSVSKVELDSDKMRKMSQR